MYLYMYTCVYLDWLLLFFHSTVYFACAFLEIRIPAIGHSPVLLFKVMACGIRTLPLGVLVVFFCQIVCPSSSPDQPVPGISSERAVFTNTYAVHISGGMEEADQLAKRHGFINLGEVSSHINDSNVSHCEIYNYFFKHIFHKNSQFVHNFYSMDYPIVNWCNAVFSTFSAIHVHLSVVYVHVAKYLLGTIFLITPSPSKFTTWFCLILMDSVSLQYSPANRACSRVYQIHQTPPAAFVVFRTTCMCSQAMDALHLPQFNNCRTFLLHVDGFWRIWDGS